MNNKQKQGAKDCFDFDPQLQEVIVTSDGSCFTKSNLASNHAFDKRLNAEETLTIRREDVMEDFKKNDEGKDESPEAKKSISKMNKTELRAECDLNEIAWTEDETNKELATKLEEFEASKV